MTATADKARLNKRWGTLHSAMISSNYNINPAIDAQWCERLDLDRPNNRATVCSK
jgi:hypothetical protein